MKKTLCGFLFRLTVPVIILAVIPWVPAAGQSPSEPASLVNPFIGTDAHGHTFPGATAPFGMVQLSPDTRLEGWDGCSGYHYSDSVIYGFSHTHLSGTGCSDYGDILIMPATGEMNLHNYGYASSFKKKEESAKPGYYRVLLHNGKILAELTASQRAGFHRYTWNTAEPVRLVLDLKHRDEVLESGMKIAGRSEIEGYRFSRAWAEKQMVYFVARFSEPFDSCVLSNGKDLAGNAGEITGKEIIAGLTFPAGAGKAVLVKVGISGVSIEGARRNLDAEIPGWDFDATAAATYESWNQALGSIRVDHGSYDQHVTFYTALYHTMIQPNLYSDVDGQYRGRDLKVHKAEGTDVYTVFSLWDTYRAAHPLYTILEPGRVNHFIRTFLLQYEQGGVLPVWELSANETNCMIGYHSVSVIADAWLKGIRDYDGEKAFAAMKHSAMQVNPGLAAYRAKGYIPSDKEGESVSKTLEYAYDDWCIAMMAKSLGKQDEYKTFHLRAQNYKNHFDRITGFMRAKSNETWFSPFDPAEVNFNYTEANAWQYSFYVPHDISGLMKLHGGRDYFAGKLDDLFAADPKTTGRDQADITGLIGQYAHGNEPSHHMAYLYAYAGVPWKTQEMVHRICRDFYKNTPDGLIGNEDCGQMSAWYVFSALGFYPVTPGSNIYAFGTPLFPKATIRLPDGKTFTVRAINSGEANRYIQSATLNGKPQTRCYITHDEIMKGGDLAFHLGPTPNKAWATGYGSFPESYLADPQILPVPAIHEGSRTFIDSTVVGISCADPAARIHYTLDGSEPGPRSSVYLRPLLLRKNTVLKAIAITPDLKKSLPIEAKFFRIPKNRKITLATSYAGQYSAGGDLALIDFTEGGENFRTGTWQGYEGVNLDATIDLGAILPVKSVSLGCLQDQGAWIFMPARVSFSVSDDGINFRDAGTLENPTDERFTGPVTHAFTVAPRGLKCRYIRVVATNRGVCPSWHPGAGKKAWIFADEITIE